jgi:hypothetical protein
MGPGSASTTMQYHQHLPNCPNVKTNKKTNHGGKSSTNNKGGWFYDELKKSALAAHETGKSDLTLSPHPLLNQSATCKTAKKQTQNLTTSQTQYHAKSKPIPVKRSVSQYEVGGDVSTTKPVKSHLQGGGKQHQFPRTSPAKGMLVQTPQRMSSLTPPNVTPLLTPGKFYAGAKFETHPRSFVLPPPPTHWTTPIQRSHSQPSTPTIKSAMNGIPIDLASLFGSPTTNVETLAKSFPGQCMIQERNKRAVDSDSSDEELKEILGEGTPKAFVKKEVVPSDSIASPRIAVNTDDLKKALGLINVNSSSVPIPVTPKKANLTCHGSVKPLKSFQEMSDQLKSLMKVAA